MVAPQLVTLGHGTIMAQFLCTRSRSAAAWPATVLGRATPSSISILRRPVGRVLLGLAATRGFAHAGFAALASPLAGRRTPRADKRAARGELHEASVAEDPADEAPPILVASTGLACNNFPAVLTIAAPTVRRHRTLRVGTLHRAVGRGQAVAARVNHAAPPTVAPPPMTMCGSKRPALAIAIILAIRRVLTPLLALGVLPSVLYVCGSRLLLDAARLLVFLSLLLLDAAAYWTPRGIRGARTQYGSQCLVAGSRMRGVAAGWHGWHQTRTVAPCQESTPHPPRNFSFSVLKLTDCDDQRAQIAPQVGPNYMRTRKNPQNQIRFPMSMG